jgi:transposase
VLPLLSVHDTECEPALTSIRPVGVGPSGLRSTVAWHQPPLEEALISALAACRATAVTSALLGPRDIRVRRASVVGAPHLRSSFARATFIFQRERRSSSAKPPGPMTSFATMRSDSMSKVFRPYHSEQTLLLPPSLRDWLAEDHLALFVSDVVDTLELTAITSGYEQGDGRGYPPHDPRMMVKLLIYGYCVGKRSSRKIERATWDEVRFRVLSGDTHPDHDSIASFRKRHLAALGALFLQVLQLCRKAGLAKLGHVAIDGTKVKANARLAHGGAASMINPAWLFVRGFERVFLRISQGASRLQEALADRGAVHAYGAPALSAGLRHVIDRSIRFDAHCEATVEDVVHGDRPLGNLYRFEPSKELDQADIEERIETAMNESSPYDSHPAPTMRLSWIESVVTEGAPPAEGDDDEAWSLFEQRRAVEKQLTAVVRARLAAGGLRGSRPEEEGKVGRRGFTTGKVTSRWTPSDWTSPSDSEA